MNARAFLRGQHDWTRKVAPLSEPFSHYTIKTSPSLSLSLPTSLSQQQKRRREDKRSSRDHRETRARVDRESERAPPCAFSSWGSGEQTDRQRVRDRSGAARETHQHTRHLDTAAMLWNKIDQRCWAAVHWNLTSLLRQKCSDRRGRQCRRPWCGRRHWSLPLRCDRRRLLTPLSVP